MTTEKVTQQILHIKGPICRKRLNPNLSVTDTKNVLLRLWCNNLSDKTSRSQHYLIGNTSINGNKQ